MRRRGMGAVDATGGGTSSNTGTVDQGSSTNTGATDTHQGLTDTTTVLKDANPSGGGTAPSGGGGGTAPSTVVPATTSVPTNWTRVAEIGAVVAGAGLIGYAVMKRSAKGKHARRR